MKQQQKKNLIQKYKSWGSDAHGPIFGLHGIKRATLYIRQVSLTIGNKHPLKVAFLDTD